MCQFWQGKKLHADKYGRSDELFVASCLQYNFQLVVFTDQTGRSLELSAHPRRIISCVPSQTELLWDLGLEKEVIGITKFCVHPAHWRKQKVNIGGTKKLHLEKIVALAPDFILANKEENEQAQIEWLSSRFPTYISDVRDLTQAVNMIITVGEITSKIEKALQFSRTIDTMFHSSGRQETSVSACYLIWRAPWMTINKDTFIHDMLNRLGFKNVFGDRKESRYPTITDSELIEANPQILFLSSEPFPFAECHLKELQGLLPKTRLQLINGEILSWYGSRLCRFDRAYFDDLRKQQ
jgi:ABC-type Fe3+-hydroxamate transport system substrate-binding protein